MAQMDGLFRLKSQLQISGLQNKDSALFQVIDSLIENLIKIAKLTNLTGGSSGGTTNITVNQINKELTVPLPSLDVGSIDTPYGDDPYPSLGVSGAVSVPINVNITNDDTLAADVRLVWVTGNSGSLPLFVSFPGLLYRPNTSTLTLGAIRLSGAIIADGAASFGTGLSAQAKVDIKQTSSTLYGLKVLTDNATDSFGVLIQAGLDSGDYALRIQNRAITLDYFTVLGNGNVGIGTATPGFPLHVIRTGAGGQVIVKLENSNADATGDVLSFFKNSASPAAADTLGAINWRGNSSTGVDRIFADLTINAVTVTNTIEDASYVIRTIVAGTIATRATITANLVTTSWIGASSLGIIVSGFVDGFDFGGFKMVGYDSGGFEATFGGYRASQWRTIGLFTNGTKAVHIDINQTVSVGGTAVRATTPSTKAIQIFDGTAPVGTLTNGISLYSAAGVPKMMNAAGTALTIAPLESPSFTTPNIGAATGTSLAVTGAITSSGGAGAGIGYVAGAGGTVTQLVSRTTTVVLNELCGNITMFSAAQAANALITFTFTNSFIAANDYLAVEHISATDGGAWNISVVCGAGTATINIRNVSTGSITSATPLRFTVIKGAIT